MLREVRDTIIAIAALVIAALVAFKYLKDYLTSLYPKGAASLAQDVKTIISSPLDTITAIKQAIAGGSNGSYITIDEMRRQSAINLAAHRAMAAQAQTAAGGAN